MNNLGPDNKKILYVGDDINYWGNIKTSFQKNYEDQIFEFHLINSSEQESNIIDSFFIILEKLPDIIYFDLSKGKENNLKLARMIRRDLTLASCIRIALTNTKKDIKQLFIPSFNFIFIKCGEWHDTVYGPVRKAFPEIEVRSDFAQAIFQKKIKLEERLRVSCITPLYMYVEANNYFNLGDIIEVKNKIPSQVLPSSSFKVKKRSKDNLYYDYKYGYDLSYNFVDDNIDDEELNQEEITERKIEYEKLFKEIKKGFRKWVMGNIAGIVPRDTKILIIDSGHNILKDSESLPDKYNYAFRYQKDISKNLSYLDYFKPHIIAIEFETIDDEDVDEDEDEFEDENEESVSIASMRLQLEQTQLFKLEKMIEEIKLADGYTPFVVVFNTLQYSSSFFREKYDYPLILSNKEKINFGLVVDMADLYEEKQDKKINSLIHNKLSILKKEQPVKYKSITVSDFKAKRYIIRKKNDLKVARYIHDAEIFSLSESEILLSTNDNLSLDSIYWLNSPVSMAITIIPAIDKENIYVEIKGKKVYEAIIHAVGEEEKKQIRQFVNEVYYSDDREESINQLGEYRSYKSAVIESLKESA